MTERRVDPIWARLRGEGRSLVWLARATGYSYSHVKAVAAGIQPAGRRFRAACARVLAAEEDALFHADRAEAMAAAG